MQIPGPCGPLEAALDEAENPSSTFAILCHPHPQYGGSMHDAVLATTAAVFLDHGINCLRFNFRGVGASAGRYDQGVGEVDDLIAAKQWMCESYQCAELWLAGYSFGSSIVWKSLDQLAPSRAFLIAPPIGAMNFEPRTAEGNVHAIAGRADDFVDVNALERLLPATTTIIEGADHFFSGAHKPLADALHTAIG